MRLTCGSRNHLGDAHFITNCAVCVCVCVCVGGGGGGGGGGLHLSLCECCYFVVHFMSVVVKNVVETRN